MKSYLLVLLTFVIASVYAHTEYPYSSTFYGCPTECETEKGPACEIDIPDDRHFVALHKRYLPDRDSKFCGSYWVGMIIDEDRKASGSYKMLRGKVIDQCGTCDETQVDLSSQMFGKISSHSTGVVKMMYVLINKDTNEIMDGPVYSDSALSSFAKRHGVSKSSVVESFKKGAKYLNKNRINSLHEFPWKSSSINPPEKKPQKPTTKPKPTIHKTTTVVQKTTVKKEEPKKTVAPKPTTVKTEIPKVNQKPIDVPTNKSTPVVPTKQIPQNNQKPIGQNQPVQNQPGQNQPGQNQPGQNQTTKHPVDQKKDDKKQAAGNPAGKQSKGGNGAPVTAGVIGLGVVGAAGVGLVMLKRKRPQTYDDLKQKFPEAFGNIKRSVSRGATTIKRGVSRSITRKGNSKTEPPPLPASYSFTLNSEDGLPRVALYDDPYPTKTSGSQHW